MFGNALHVIINIVQIFQSPMQKNPKIWARHQRTQDQEQNSFSTISDSLKVFPKFANYNSTPTPILSLINLTFN